MAFIRLTGFPAKTSPVPADILYLGDSANSYTESKSTIQQIIDGAGVLKLAGGTMSGTLTLNTSSPSGALEAASKGYVDMLALGLNVVAACTCATTTALNATYSNGASGVGSTLINAGSLAAFTADGITPTLGQRILVKNQASTFQNGIYTITTLGTGAIAWILTRATDYDTAAEITPGDFVLINTGSTQAATSWIQTATVVTMGTSPISFSLFGAAFPISMSNGGTGAAISPVNNGIVYSNSTNMAILPTANNAALLTNGSGVPNMTVLGTGVPTALTNALVGSQAALAGALGVSSFTPAIAFGGASVGITYAVQQGLYFFLGNAIFITVNIQLTSKGSSTGGATITGLPTTNPANAAFFPNFIPVWTNLTVTNDLLFNPVGSTTTAQILDTRGLHQLDNTSFNNNSSMVFWACYLGS